MRIVMTFLLVAVASITMATMTSAQDLTGSVKIDGSSTVGPISMAMAEEFMGEYPGVRVTVGISGTGGGFKKFIAGETDISDASRPIKQSEIDGLKAAGAGFIELPVAFDGLAVLVNPGNTWVDYLSVDELKAITEPDSKINNWSQVRSGFPNHALNLYVPGTDSGTFEYFTEAIVGEAGAHRSDCAAMSEDDNVLVTGIAGDKGALGYFGYAYYAENMAKLKLVPVRHEGKTVAPSPTTINNGTYQPLSRPIFIYVNTNSRGRAEIDEFVNYYLLNASWIVPEVGYVALPDEIYELGLKHYEDNVGGSMFAGGGATVGVSLQELMAKLSQQ